MESTKLKLEQEIDQFSDEYKNENMPTIIRNQRDEKPNFDLLYDKKIEENKFYKEFNDFADIYNRTISNNTKHEIIRKKYETIKIRVIDVTSLTNDT